MRQPGKDEAARTLREELADPRYERESSGRLREAVDRLLDWFDTQSFQVGSFEISYGPVILLILLILAIVLCIVLVRPRLQSPRSGDAPLGTEPGIAAAELRERALALATAGEWDRAYRERFRALVREAEERGVLPARPGQTASEAAREIGDRHTEHGPELSSCAETFNGSVYGGQAPTAEAYRRLAALDEQLLAADAGSGRAAGAALDGPKMVAPR